MNTDLYLIGLVHFINDLEDGEMDDLFDALATKFSMHLQVMSYSGSGVTLRQDGKDKQRSKLRFIETVEKCMERKNNCLIEYKISRPITSETIENIFSMIDVLQRIADHYRVTPERLKVFFRLC